MLPADGWTQLFTGLDTAVVAAICVLSLVLQRSTRVSDDAALLIPAGIGLLYGLTDALSAPWGGLQIVLKDAMLYGAGAAVAARGMSLAWDKLSPPSGVQQ